MDMDFAVEPPKPLGFLFGAFVAFREDVEGVAGTYQVKKSPSMSPRICRGSVRGSGASITIPPLASGRRWCRAVSYGFGTVSAVPPKGILFTEPPD